MSCITNCIKITIIKSVERGRNVKSVGLHFYVPVKRWAVYAVIDLTDEGRQPCDH